jgi:hypothetical protein
LFQTEIFDFTAKIQKKIYTKKVFRVIFSKLFHFCNDFNYCIKKPLEALKKDKRKVKRQLTNPCLRKKMKNSTKYQNTDKNTNRLLAIKNLQKHQKATPQKKTEKSEKSFFQEKARAGEIKKKFHFSANLFAHEIFLPYLCIVKQKDHVV